MAPRLSLQHLLGSLRTVLNRFPLTAAYVALMTLWLITLIWEAESKSFTLSDNVKVAFSYLFGEGILTTLAIKLWSEYLSARKWLIIAQISANTLLAADFVYLLLNAESLGSARAIARAAVTAALVTAIFFVPAKGKRMQWFYTYAMFGNAVATALIAIAMNVAVGIIYFTFSALFYEGKFEVYLSLTAIGSFAIPAMLFLYRIPSPRSLAESGESHAPARFTLGLVRYLLFPLSAIYMGILYAYGLKILITWELPRGVVSWSVTGMTVAAMFLYFMLGAVCRDGNAAFFTKIRKWTPLAMLPLLALMSVAIFHRIGEYGITTARLYVATFNIWSYAAMVWLHRKGERGFNAVPASFAALFLLVSVIPGANYTSLTNSYMRSRVMAVLREAGAEHFPISRDEAQHLKDKMDKEVWRTLSSRLCYLDSKDDHSQVESIVDFPVQTSSWQYDLLFDDVHVEEVIPVEQMHLLRHAGSLEIPKGYDRVKYINGAIKNDLITDAWSNCIITYEKTCTIKANIDSIAAIGDGGDPTSLKMEINGLPLDKAVFIPTKIDLTLGHGEHQVDLLRVYGYVFSCGNCINEN